MVLPRLELQAKGAFCPEEVIGRVVLKKRRKLELVAGMMRKDKKLFCKILAVFLRYIFAGLVLLGRVSFLKGFLRIIWRF